MTATDELRRLLDERGVEWGNIRNDGSESDYLTEWQFEGIQSYAVATEWAVGGGLSLETHRHHLTPEQAIAATLGAVEYRKPTTLSQLEDENAKLREELAKARDPQRIGGQADPSSFVYTIEQLREFRWQHATNDEDAIPYINNVAAAHERENAKLREERDMYRDLVGCMVHPDIPDQLAAENAKLREEVVDLRRSLQTYESEKANLRELVLDLYRQLLNAYDPKELDEFVDRMRELGVEVDG